MGLIERVAEHWTEHRLVPLDLTDTEILDWLGEYCDKAVYVRSTPNFSGVFSLYSEEGRTNAPTLREAVCLAAAKQKEVNRDH